MNLHPESDGNDGMPGTTLDPRIEDVQRHLAGTLSHAGRRGHVAMLASAVLFAGAVGSLLLTEPDLPTRTRLAFAAIVIAAASWGTFSVWTLRQRHLPLPTHDLIAARLALGVSGVFLVGALILAASGTAVSRAAGGASVVGAILAGLAWIVWRRAHRRVRDLRARRRALEQQLADGLRR
jgi:hypothetical protein